MSTPLTATPSSTGTDPRAAALAALRRGANPFGWGVAAAGTMAEALRTDVRTFARHQLADLHKIVRLYRDGRPGTRVYAVLGDPGAGKTHLLYVLLAELRELAAGSGDETLTVVMDRLSPATDPIDYLGWQVVNQLLARRADGERLLRAVAARLTARLLAEALRRQAPHQHVGLIPPAGPWEALRLRFGSAPVVQRRLTAVADLILRCEGSHPTGESLRAACAAARLPVTGALTVLSDYLDKTESDDPRGWFRKALYARLAGLTLLDDRGPFEEFHNGEYGQAPANVRDAGNLVRVLLDVWLELLGAFAVPVLVVFDQLETFLAATDPVQAALNHKQFTQTVTSFVDQVPNVCVLVFGELTFWSELVTKANPYTHERLAQPVALPGQPAFPYIRLPNEIDRDVLAELVRRRVRAAFPEVDWTGLSDSFPFSDADLAKIGRQLTIREYLRVLARQYDELVHPSPARPDRATLRPATSVPTDPLWERLEILWNEQVTAARIALAPERSLGTSIIPKLQNAIHWWLRKLFDEAITGSGPWANVELITAPTRKQYGYLNVIRTDDPNLPGVGIAVWVASGASRPKELRERIAFFGDNPCPIRTLVLLRADGEGALEGQTGDTYRRARSAGRDVRVEKYEPRHLHALMAFTPWLQAATPEVQAAGPDKESVFKQFLADRSKELLDWIDRWRRPNTTGTHP